MFSNKNFAFIIPLILLIITSCGKYEEGPEFTLLTKKQRLIGDWKLEEAMLNGQAQNVEDFAEYTLTFERDGTARITFGALFQKGTWEFVDDKKKLRTIDVNGQMTEPTIIRLTNKELWLKDPNGDLNKLKAK